MSTIIHGGRIVPILKGHQQHLPDSTPNPNVLKHSPLTHSFASSPSLSHHHISIDQGSLLDQRKSTLAMRQKAMDQKSLEMSCLKERGLFALPTEGDGNCLYYSLSDQLYGTFEHAAALRHSLADHMANHRKYFMQFVVAQGGERRRPKRAAASAYATRSADTSAPSEEDKERQFEEMVASTRRNGEWGNSEHLQAFCQVFKVDINVYTSDGVQVFRDVYASHDEPRDVIHIAFHDFKHYSSVRVVDGCHTGLFIKTACRDQNSEESKEIHHQPKDSIPKVEDELPVKDSNATSKLSHSKPFGPNCLPSPSDLATAKDSDLAVDVFPPWDIQSIQDGLGGRYDRDTIVDMLQKCRGDIDRAFAALLGEMNDGAVEKTATSVSSLKPSLQVSRSSSPFSTGSKRSADASDDSDGPCPAVRRGRPRRRLMSNLTLGVGISFRDDHNELVSLNLRMKSDAEKKVVEAENEALKQSQHPDRPRVEAAPEQSEMAIKKGPRRSGRLSKPRSA